MSARCLGLLFVLCAACSGCHEFDLFPFYDKEQAQEKARQSNVRSALRGEDGHSRFVGEYIKIGDNGYIKVQGVGLVDRLDGTGEDPPASHLRTMLLEDLRRHEVKDPQKYISSANTALVVVTAYIPPICKKGDTIDVEITLPDGSESVSLAGGWLMPCYLKEMALMKGELHEGKEIVMASGPVLIDALGEQTSVSASALRRGRIPGGAKYVGDDRILTVAIKNEYRTVRMSKLLAERIGRRFHDYDEHGIRRPLAEAKTNARLEMSVHERYRDNYPRYLQCIRSMWLTESPVEKHMRMQELAEQVKFGPAAEEAALRLEAIGPEAIPTLKTGLTSPDLEARFHSGVALAYLGNTDGVPALEEAAAKEPAFRVFALAALSALPDGSAGESLRNLMNLESIETRYGAFRAFSTMSPNDPFIKGVQMDGHFSLHPVESTGHPLVHITRFKKAEVVVFKDDQEFLTPLVLRAGNRVIVQGTAHDHRVTVKRIAPGEQVQEKVVSSQVVDVISAASQLGATYPDIVEMLVQAERQHNLQGHLAIDELPQPGRVYERPRGGQSIPESVKIKSVSEGVTVGSEGVSPNLFNEKPPQDIQSDPEPSVPAAPKKPNLREDP
ncbi:flagellar basal body P-ring protein FlgI [Planctomicrobium piriforme]|uniref:p-ring protein n=1 Tax=Planctomicrobium piriforme TaxID=1576369 RepID=A0A1I3LE17_9PLAN|nr:flagellar basal body P-ring protein FlgI [Planctomicrobium piriforme]SFI82625.1 P-ring protein [Planctomicrobium piriforme]